MEGRVDIKTAAVMLRFFFVNLGTGKGTSVPELGWSSETESNRQIPYKIVAGRPGDVACSFADVDLLTRLLQWKAQRSIALIAYSVPWVRVFPIMISLTIR